MVIKKKTVKRGRPKKVKEVVEEIAEEVIDQVLAEAEPIIDEAVEKAVDSIIEGRCACGEPLAEGQTFVCKKHIKAN